jgi:asparagine synthase (glutamine-hydrolysing)
MTQAQAKDLFGSGDDALFSLNDSAASEHLIGLDPHQLAPVERTRIERVLDLAVWIDMYKPTIVF